MLSLGAVPRAVQATLEAPLAQKGRPTVMIADGGGHHDHIGKPVARGVLLQQCCVSDVRLKRDHGAGRSDPSRGQEAVPADVRADVEDHLARVDEVEKDLFGCRLAAPQHAAKTGLAKAHAQSSSASAQHRYRSLANGSCEPVLQVPGDGSSHAARSYPLKTARARARCFGVSSAFSVLKASRMPRREPDQRPSDRVGAHPHIHANFSPGEGLRRILRSTEPIPKRLETFGKKGMSALPATSARGD